MTCWYGAGIGGGGAAWVEVTGAVDRTGGAPVDVDVVVDGVAPEAAVDGRGDVVVDAAVPVLTVPPAVVAPVMPAVPDDE
jgi:hypothetical protein